MELIDLVNSVIISNDLTQLVSFPTHIPDCDSHNPTLLDFFLLMLVFVLNDFRLGSSNHAFVSVSIDFLSNSGYPDIRDILLQ